MKKTLVFICLFALTGNLYAQKKSKKNDKPQPAAAQATQPAGQNLQSNDFKTTESGIEYKFNVDEAGAAMPKVGDYVEVNITTAVGDSVIFESKKVNNNQPVQFQINPPTFKGDLVEALMLMTPGDDITVRLSVDSLIKAGTPAQPWMKKGENQKIVYNIQLVSVKSQDQMKKEQEEKAAAQVKIDDQLLQDYFKANNIKPNKTASGLYYKIDKQGTGETVKAGQKVTVNYTGKLLDGTVFDSNVDPKFSHVQPFSFTVGQHQVISGWDEGLQLMKKGSKGVLYIPSTLAYGPREQGPIKANSVLIFDVEVTDIE